MILKENIVKLASLGLLIFINIVIINYFYIKGFDYSESNKTLVKEPIPITGGH